MRWLPRGLEGKARRGSATAPAVFRTAPNPYLSVWDPDRAVNEALTRVTWVFRCVDAIAGNAAKIPFVMRRGNAKDGAEIPNHPLNLVMNSQANVGEDSFSFRYRLSSQLLLSSRGVFIEIVRNNAGEPIAFVLLPPQYTKPIPDPKTFVRGYEVSSATYGGLPGPNKVVLPPDRVLWLRRPHPMDPYGSLTPLEAAGLAVESDWLARLYNRNFMLNDGRPGGLIVIKGVVTEEDKEELRARYRGNINTAGRIGVLSSDEGADFVDTAVHPRDMQYNELRDSTRDELCAAFGVDLAVIGNVAGRTFDNAEQARLTFWMETMTTHLELIARPLDRMDNDAKIFASFDISGIDVLQRAEIKRRDFLLKEVNLGTRTGNEYRTEIQLPKLTEGGDTIHVLNTYSPVGSTKKGGVEAEQKLVLGPEPPAVPPHDHPAVPGQGTPSAGQPARPPTDQNRTDPESPASQPQGTPARPRNQRPVQQAASVDAEETRRKHLEDQFKAQMLAVYDRWELIYERALQRLFERQQRVVLEKVNGPKATKRWAVQADITDLIFDQKVYSAQIIEDLMPVWTGIVQEFASYIDPSAKLEGEEYAKARREHENLLRWLIGATEKGIRGRLSAAADAGDDIPALSDSLKDYFAGLQTKDSHELARKAVNEAGESGMRFGRKEGDWIAVNGSERKALYVK